MKILKLILNNINSLKGHNSIDFEKNFNNNLFLITGDTGAGKSTILDAICCALYNNTPRLKDARQLLSKHTGEANITLEYESNNDRYRNSWSIQRAYKKVDGALATTPKMEIAKLNTSTNEYEILETKISIVPKLVQEITGLDFSQFQKSMLLSQGNFDAFLKAKSDDRASLLEKMTGTKIYTEIGKKSYEVYKQMNQGIEEIKIKLGEITVFDDTQLQEYQQSKIKLESDIKELSKKQEQNNKIVNEIDKKESLNNDIEKFKKNLQNAKENLKALEESKKNLKTQNKEIEKSNYKFLTQYESEKEIIDKVITLDIEIQNIQKNSKDIEKSIKESDKKSHELQELRSTKNTEIENLKTQNKISLEYLARNCVDESLLHEYKLVDSKITEYLKLKKSVDKYKQNIEKIKKEEQESHNLYSELTKNLTFSKERLQYIQSKTIVLRYEDERESLQKGEKCPLCGSKEHPYKELKISFGEEIESLQEEQIQTIDEIKEFEKKIRAYENLKIQNTSKLESLQENLESTRSEFEIFRLELEKLLTKYSFSLHENLNKVKENLQQRFDDYTLHFSKVENYRQELQIKETDIKILVTQENLNNEQNKKEKTELESTKSEYEEKSKKREVLFATKNPKVQKKILEDKKEELNNSLNIIVQNIEKNSIEIESNKNRILEYNSYVESKTKELNGLSKDISLEDKENLLNLAEKFKKDLEHINREYGELSQKLKNNDSKLKSSKRFLDEMAIQQKQIKPYEILNELIGDAEGKKFKKFAQNLTLGHLLTLANKHLKTLNERYILIKDKEKDLEIMVIDTHQADISRSVNSLSGGESFLVSLALALGLSDMVSSKVSIDSLFLDEGFGTLDSQTLNDAITTLAKLQDSGKMIGIISHVEILKSEISSQIQVKKGSNGIGTLSIV